MIVIDISAILMTLVSITGLVLIFFVHKRLRTGMPALAIGTVLCGVVYPIWVPRSRCERFGSLSATEQGFGTV